MGYYIRHIGWCVMIVALSLSYSGAFADVPLMCDPKENATVCELMAQRNNAMNELAATAGKLRMADEKAEALKSWWAKYVDGVSIQSSWWHKYVDGLSVLWGALSENKDANSKVRH